MTCRAHSVWLEAPITCWCYGVSVNPTKPPFKSPAAMHPKASTPFTIEGGNWILSGNGLTEAATTAVNRRNESQLGDRALDVLRVVNDRANAGQLTCAADVMAKVGISQDQARVYLNRLADTERITKTGKGVYSSVTPVTTVTPQPTGEQPKTDVTHITPDSRQMVIAEKLAAIGRAGDHL